MVHRPNNNLSKDSRCWSKLTVVALVEMQNTNETGDKHSSAQLTFGETIWLYLFILQLAVFCALQCVSEMNESELEASKRIQMIKVFSANWINCFKRGVTAGITVTAWGSYTMKLFGFLGFPTVSWSFAQSRNPNTIPKFLTMSRHKSLLHSQPEKRTSTAFCFGPSAYDEG